MQPRLAKQTMLTSNQLFPARKAVAGKILEKSQKKIFGQIIDIKARAEGNPKKNIWPARQTMLTSKQIKVRALSGSQNCFEKHHQA